MSAYQLVDVVSLLKVFDEHFLSDEGYMAIADIDINDSASQVIAINLLVVPEYSSLSQESQNLAYSDERECLVLNHLRDHQSLY